MNRTNIYLPDPAIKQLKAIAKKEGVSFAELVRRAINEYLKKTK